MSVESAAEKPLPVRPAATGERAGYPEVIAAFNEISGATTEHTDIDALLRMVAERICELVGVRRCSAYLKDEGTGLFRGRVAHADRDIDAAIRSLTAGIEADGFTREILSTKRPVLIGNARSDPRPVRSTMLEWGVHAMLGVPMVRGGEVIGLLFLDNEDLPHEYTEEEQALAATFANLAAIAISHAQLTSELRAGLETVKHQNTLLRNAAVIDDRLRTLVLEGAGLGEVAGAVADRTSKPAIVLDSDMRLLASASEDGSGDALDRLLGDLRHDPALAEAIESTEGKRPRTVDAEASPKLKNRLLVAPVSVGEEAWGYLVVVEHGTRFTARDRVVARRAATIVAMEMSAERRAADAQMRAQEALARDIVMGGDDPDSLQRRADFHGVRLDSPHVVCLFAGGKRRLSPREVLEGLSGARPESRPLVATVEAGIAAVIELPGEAEGSPATPAKRIVTDALGAISPDGTATAAVSGVCSRPSQYPAAFREAEQVSRCISVFCAPGTHRVLAAHDLGAARLLLTGTAREEAERFARDTIGVLLEDDNMHDLLSTLQAFFASSRSVRRSAERLGVHENTVRYRLGRIEETTGLRVGGDADDQLTMQLAILILRLGGTLPPAETLESEVELA